MTNKRPTRSLELGGAAVRPAWTALLAAYLATVSLLPWLERPVVISAAAFTTGLLLFIWVRAGRPLVLGIVAGVWPSLHLLLAGTGGAASPLLPLLVLWVAAVADRAGLGRGAGMGLFGVILLVAGDVWVGVAELDAATAAFVGTGVGLLIALGTEGLRRRAADQERRLDRIAAEAEATWPTRGEAEAARRLDEMELLLSQLARRLGARRATLWDLIPQADRVVARCSSGQLPPPQQLGGSPLEWAVVEGLPLRLDSVPEWAGGVACVCVVPGEERGRPASAVLTLEFAPLVQVPEPAALPSQVLELWSLLRLHRRESEAVAARERAKEVIDILRRLPHRLDLDLFARELAGSAMRLIGGTGAAVGVWDGDTGRILGVVGEDGGPTAGQEFTGIESELALAASGACIVREARKPVPASLPVATVAERWQAEPRGLVALPLEEPSGRRNGVVAVWTSTQSCFESDAIAALDTLTRYAALLMQHSKVFSELRRSAERDQLTGLHNRAAFDKRLGSEHSQSRRYSRPVSLIMLDLDFFKEVNDTYGHEAGDVVLKAVGNCLNSRIREVDFAARVGGEEFVLLLPETRLADAVETAERFRSVIAALRVEWRGRPLAVRVSAGVAAYPECVADPADLLRAADGALYEAKRAGRNCVRAAPQVVG